MVKTLIVSLLIVFLCVPFAAQIPPEDPPVKGPGPSSPGERGVDRREMGRLYLAQRMREKLELTDAQTLKVLDVLDEISKAQNEQRVAVEALAKEVKAHLDNPETKDEVFKRDVEKFKKLREDLDGKLRKLEEKMLQIMSPRQQVKFIVLRKQLLRGARSYGPAGRPSGRRGGSRKRQIR